MNVIEATYIINTPMFLGSADNESAEIRPPSFKGIIRFWFRALALAEFNGDKDEVERLEGIVFGSTKGSNAQKALYSLKVDRKNLKGKGKDIEESRQGIVYLGYGLIGYDKKSRCNKYIRDYIESNNSIKVVLMSNIGIESRLEERDIELGAELLINSLKCLGIFGGLGSRARRGFGSLTLLDLKNNGQTIIKIPYGGTSNVLKEEIKELLSKSRKYGDKIDNIDNINIEYTAFSKFTKVVITKEFDDPMELLNEIGKEMIRYRSYGRNGKVLKDEKAEKIFENDHNLVYEYVRGGKIDKHPKRVVFGLPHNYRLSYRLSAGDKGSTININSTHRRASPLFIHIHKLANDKYIGVITLIPAKFLKDDDKIKISQSGKGLKQEPKQLEANVEYKVIEDFLVRIVNNLVGKAIL